MAEVFLLFSSPGSCVSLSSMTNAFLINIICKSDIDCIWMTARLLQKYKLNAGQVVKSWFASVSPGSLCNGNAFCMLVKNLPNRLAFGIYSNSVLKKSPLWSETAGETRLAFYFWCEEHTWRLNTLCFVWGNKTIHCRLLIKAVLKNVPIVIALLPNETKYVFIYSFQHLHTMNDQHYTRH